MIRIQDQEKKNYIALFEAYRHSIPVIYSSLHGQYPGEILLEKEGESSLALLTTPFCFHFVAGDANFPDAAGRLHSMLFDSYLKATHQPEAIVFCPDETWHPMLEDVFQRHHGVRDVRKRFKLNRELFQAAVSQMAPPADVQVTLTEEQESGSAIIYPVCRIIKDGACVSFCSAFMLGKGHAELDVGTEEGYRGHGYAKRAAATLIAELLKRNIEPDWCTWPYRKESQMLAQTIGFEPLPDVLAYIWTEADCGKLEG